MVLTLDGSEHVSETARVPVGSSCALAMTPVQVDIWNRDLAVLGAPFLRYFYTIYDFGNRRIGFVRARHSASPRLRRVSRHRSA
mmetsp:Transcript_33390/g.74774  ORF Transcript_33390/g.74774 Transcript_33390/m.74774 type:complete len:84 (+) Transcript_33390:1066-1317(+)